MGMPSPTGRGGQGWWYGPLPGDGLGTWFGRFRALEARCRWFPLESLWTARDAHVLRVVCSQPVVLVLSGGRFWPQSGASGEGRGSAQLSAVLQMVGDIGVTCPMVTCVDDNSGCPIELCWGAGAGTVVGVPIVSPILHSGY